MIALRDRVSSGAALAVVALTSLVGCGTDDGSTVTTPVTDTTTSEGDSSDAPPDDADEPAAAIERRIFDLVNTERRERGLEELEWDDQLAGLARDWSGQMADEGRLEHQEAQRMLERADGFTGVGENIFRATGPVPASTIHVGWMRSEGHRANILRPAFDTLGVGVVCTDDGEVWATQRFGRAAPAGGAAPTDEVPPEEPIVASEGEGPACPGGRGDAEIELR